MSIEYLSQPIASKIVEKPTIWITLLGSTTLV